MPIILVTGANGHGKGQFIIREILKLQDENDHREKQGKPRRTIYANIHGVNTPEVKPLKDVQPIPSDKIFFGKQDNPDDPPPKDYFIPPIGSIFIYDEAQKIDFIKQKSGALSNDIRVRSMEEHRHAGLDIYLLTQSPNYIHSHIQGLVSPHYYLERPLGLPTTNVFKFNKYQARPENAKNKADDHQVITLGKKYGKYYKSSAEHNMKSQIPLKLKIAVVIAVLCLAYTYNKFSQTKYYKQETIVETEQTTKQDQPIENQTVQQNQQQQQLIEAIQQLEIAKKEIELYKQRLDETYRVEAKNPELRISNVIQMGKDCKAYNMYGDLLKVSYSECVEKITEVGKIQRNRQTESQSIQPTINNDIMTIEH